MLSVVDPDLDLVGSEIICQIQNWIRSWRIRSGSKSGFESGHVGFKNSFQNVGDCVFRYSFSQKGLLGFESRSESETISEPTTQFLIWISKIISSETTPMLSILEKLEVQKSLAAVPVRRYIKMRAFFKYFFSWD